MRKKIKPHYLACIWCGKDIPKNKTYAMYCSVKCKEEAKGKHILKGCEINYRNQK